MTPAQIKAMRASFARIEPALSILGYRFYEKLFLAAPKLRPLIGSDLHGRQRKLTQAITELVQRRSTMAFPALDGDAGRMGGEAAGSRAVDISPDYLTVMRATFLELLRGELAEDFTDDIEDAWRAAFEVLSRSMLESETGSPLPTADDSFFSRLSHTGSPILGSDGRNAKTAEITPLLQ